MDEALKKKSHDYLLGMLRQVSRYWQDAMDSDQKDESHRFMAHQAKIMDTIVAIDGGNHGRD